MKKKEIATKGSTLDIGTTMLSYMHFPNDLGLGRNLFDDSEQMRLEREIIQRDSYQWREPILRFWDFPKITNTLELHIPDKKMYINDRVFDLPVFVKVGDELQTSISFAYRNSSHMLMRYRKSMESEKHFLLIDFCKNIDTSYTNESKLCLLTGSGRRNNALTELENTTYTFSRDRLCDMLHMSECATSPPQ